MENLNLQPLFEYLDERFAKVDAQLAEINFRLNKHDEMFDHIMKSLKRSEDEHHVIFYQLDVLENWAKLIGEKVGVAINL